MPCHLCRTVRFCYNHYADTSMPHRIPTPHSVSQVTSSLRFLHRYDTYKIYTSMCLPLPYNLCIATFPTTLHLNTNTTGSVPWYSGDNKYADHDPKLRRIRSLQYRRLPRYPACQISKTGQGVYMSVMLCSQIIDDPLYNIAACS